VKADLDPHGQPLWFTFADPGNRRALIVSLPSGRPECFCPIEHDPGASKPGVYDVWRERTSLHQTSLGSEPPCEIRCVEIHHRDGDRFEPTEFPDHLLNRGLLGDLTLWGVDSGFLQWTEFDVVSSQNSGAPSIEVEQFIEEVGEFAGFTESVFTVGDLLADTNWPWGKAAGVYVFATGDKVVYVGRALGAGLGARIWNQLNSQSDPDWRAIVADDKTLVRVFKVDSDQAYMASAFEAYLINRFQPVFNRKCQ